MSYTERAKIEKLYNGGGFLIKDSWKEDSDKLIDRDVIREIYRKLRLKGVIPNLNQDFVFVSPTSHIPTHEQSLFELDALERKGKGTFLVGDIRFLSLKPSQKKRELKNSILQVIQANAAQIPVKDGVADIIWDRKGWLWHIAKDKNLDFFRQNIDQYGNKLKQGGAIVIDAIEDSTAYLTRNTPIALIKALLGQKIRVSNLYQVHSQYERSTYEMINNSFGYKIWEELEKEFMITSMGYGKSRVVVLRKNATV